MTTSRDGPPDLEKAGFRRTTSSVFTRSSTNSLSKSTGQQRSNGKIRAAWNYVLPCISWMWNGDGKVCVTRASIIRKADTCLSL